MRILHVIPSFAPAWRYGGPVRAAYEMCRALAARGHEVTVMTTDIDGDGRLPVPAGRPVAMDGFTVRYFPIGKPRAYCYSTELTQALNAEASTFDVAHIHSMFLWPTTAAARACRAAGVPYLLRPAGSLDPMCLNHAYETGLKPLLSRLKKAVYFRASGLNEINGAAAIHFTSASERDNSADARFRVPSLLVPLGVRPEAGLPGFWEGLAKDAAGRKIVLYLSRLDPKKGLDLLIASLGNLASRRDDFVLAVAGDGDESYRARLETLAAHAGLAGRCFFLGRIDGGAKWSLFEAADIFVLPSHHENFGLAAAEALAAGLPCILSEGVAVSAEAAATGAALRIPLTSIALETALERLLNDDSLRSTLGEAGRDLADRIFSWPAVARRLEEAYIQLVRKNAETLLEIPA